MDRMKSMPYRLEDGAMERMKIRACAAVRGQQAKSNKGARVLRWSLSFAVAVVLCFVVLGYMELTEPTYYEQFMELVAEAPEDALYELSADMVEYAEDMTLL